MDGGSEWRYAATERATDDGDVNESNATAFVRDVVVALDTEVVGDVGGG